MHESTSLHDSASDHQMPPLWVRILGDSIVRILSTVEMSHVQRGKPPGTLIQTGTRGVGLSWGWLGDNKAATRKLIFWDVAKLKAGWKCFEELSLCSCYTNVEVWSVGGSSWRALFLTPEICQAFWLSEYALIFQSMRASFKSRCSSQLLHMNSACWN